MIVQEFYYDEKIFLTIVHENMDEDVKNRNIDDSININEHIISFNESYVDEFNLDDNDYLFIEGFLDCNNEKNPYKDYCAFYKEFADLNYDNPFEDNSPTLPLKEYNLLSNFIKEYANYNFTKCSFGNVLFFSSIKIKAEFYLDYPPYFKIMGDDVRGNAFVKFKVNEIILESQIIEDIFDGQKILSKCDWNNCEIEIYDGNELLYKNHHNLIRNIDLKVNMNTENFKVKLKKSEKQFSLSPSNYESFTNNEIKPLDVISSYLTDETNFYSNFINVEKDNCTFLRKNEREKAYDLFDNLLRNSGDVWIFDPYFFDENSFGVITDFLMFFINNNHRKHIVFSKYFSSFENFKNQLNSSELAFFKDFGFSKVDFIESPEHFHDRFIFFVSKNKIEGFQLGTSINSFGENYSNIIKLSPFCCHYIFKILMEDIVSENIFKICD